MNILDFLRLRQNTDPDRALKEIRDSYRRVFTGFHGKQVLTHLLSELHFFDEVVEGNEVVLANFARRLLYYIGAWDHKNLEDQSLVSALLAIPLKDEQGQPERTKGADLIEAKA